MSTISLVPIGHISEDVPVRLGSRLSEIFPHPCSVGLRMELPPDAFNVERSQFLATCILEKLGSLVPPDEGRVLGITEVDLYVPDLNFVFGLADVNGTAAIISICRLREEFYGLACDEDLFMRRMVKEALHELGHSFGLGHCQNPCCVMFFSNSLSDTDRKKESFCAVCQERLRHSP
jgi:archaemetzincin